MGMMFIQGSENNASLLSASSVTIVAYAYDAVVPNCHRAEDKIIRAVRVIRCRLSNDTY